MDKKIVAKELIFVAKMLMAKEYPKGEYYADIALACSHVFNGDSYESGKLRTKGKYKDELRFSIEKWTGGNFFFTVRNEAWKNGFHEGEQISAKSAGELIFKCEEALKKRLIKHFDEYTEKSSQDAAFRNKFPNSYTLSFDVQDRENPEIKGKIVIPGKHTKRSEGDFVEYESRLNSTRIKYVWTFDTISYRRLYDEWSYGHGAEREGRFPGSPKDALKTILEWQAVHNNWNHEVSNIKVSFY